MKIYLASQLIPDKTQWKTLLKLAKRERERERIKILLSFFHHAGGFLNQKTFKLIKENANRNQNTS